MSKHLRWNRYVNQFDVIGPSDSLYDLVSTINTDVIAVEIETVPIEQLRDFVKKFNAPIVLLEHTSDPLINSTKLIEQIQDLNCFLVTSRYQPEYEKEIVFPKWLFEFSKQSLPKIEFGNKQYMYSCLNRTPKLWRIELYEKIKSANLLTGAVYTFNNVDPNTGFKIQHTDFPLAWKDEKVTNDHTINHDAYLDSYCNVVTETVIDLEFSSEKTWKPIAAGQLFVTLAHSGHSSWLNRLGIETFSGNTIDEIVDFLKQDLESLYFLNIDRIKHNHRMFCNRIVHNTIIQTALNTLVH